MVEDLYRLERRGDLAPEEEELAELMTTLIEKFDERHHPLDNLASPHERLGALIEQGETTQAEISKLLGSRSLVSAILQGKRAVSKANARKLAEHLRVPAEWFI